MKPRIRQMLNLLSKAVKSKSYWKKQCRKAKSWDSYDRDSQALWYWGKAEIRLSQRLVEFGSDYIFEGHYVIEHKAALYR